MTAEAIVKRRRVAAPRLTHVNALVIRVEESVDGGLLGEVDRLARAAFLGCADQLSLRPIDILPIPQLAGGFAEQGISR